MALCRHLWVAAALLLCLQQCCVLSGAPLSSSQPQLDEWVSKVQKASSHKHWEHIVKRSAYSSRFGYNDVVDDTAHIVDVQDYYRTVLEQGWDEYSGHEKELFDLLNTLERVVDQAYNRPNLERVTSQSVENALSFGVHTKPIPGRYMVMFQGGTSDYTLDRTMAVMKNANLQSGQRVRATDMTPVRHAGKGFIATLNKKAVELMSKHPGVAFIEEDTALRRSEVMTHEDQAAEETGNSVPWNLDRLDQRAKTLDHSYDPNGDGSNVDIYIIDTGVRATHQQLEGRVHYAGFDAVDALTGTHNRGEDCNGHGTHCAGTAAGKTFGVARAANIYNLRALNCEGSGAVSGIVQGIDRIIRHYKEGGSEGRRIVISQSLGVKKSASLNGAIEAATDAGIVCVGAAGNQASYSCDYSPASATMGISVGATDKNDEVTIFTNTGECTTIMAPGTQITSSWRDCDDCTRTMSGTSMAAPHAAGYAAIVLSANPRLTPGEVMAKMIEQSTKNHVSMSRIATAHSHTTPNRLLYVESKAAAANQGGSSSDEVASIQGMMGSRP